MTDKCNSDCNVTNGLIGYLLGLVIVLGILFFSTCSRTERELDRLDIKLHDLDLRILRKC